MPINIKRSIFFTLLIIFLIYTVFVFNAEPINKVGYLSQKAQQGKLIFQKYNCISCHQIYGLGGYMGPDLTNVISTQGKGVEYAKAFIVSGTQKMPNFHIPNDEIEMLLSYLTDISKSGISPIIKFDVNVDGSIQIKD
ncbi:MAG: cytochrome c [Bacteroidetes bacterium]|nr:cytochrome c [Bacteroidota bacterium]